jgi:allantoate deiminase
MRAAGLSVRVDSAGNLIGRAEASRKGAKTLLIGSHLDTVRDAGRFDGILGVLLPIAALELILSRGIELPFAVEILGFSEEEGVRFSSAYIGSKAYAGLLRSSDLRLRDPDGISLGEALAKFKGRRFTLPRPAHSRAGLMGYIEVHIEQGPVLESRGQAADVVCAIAGQTRARVAFRGRAGHAGTTPMPLRRDALAGAAEFVLAAESLARRRPPLVATVGRISVRPGAANVIAGEAEFSLDVRHPLDSKRLGALRELRGAARRIARRRGLAFSIEVTQDNPAVACSKELTGILAQCVRRGEGRSAALTSGAGHDAVIISSIAPVAMLFVRCRGGLSHHPDEFVRRSDIAAAFRIVVDFLLHVASRFDP